jgi:hypothetical protein
MVQTPSGEADSGSAGQEMLFLLWKQKAHYILPNIIRGQSVVWRYISTANNEAFLYKFRNKYCGFEFILEVKLTLLSFQQ